MSPSSQANTNTEIWLAGAFAAFTVDILVYPLDTLKTRLQSPDYRRRYLSNASSTRKLLANPAMYRGLYQGVSSAIIATLPSSGAFFITYEAIKSGLSPSNNLSTSSTTSSHSQSQSQSPLNLPLPFIHATASALAELVSCAILTPAEVIKQNAQVVVVNNNDAKNTHESKSKSTSRGGGGSGSVSATAQAISRFRSQPTELWRGYTALAGRNLPFTALQFPLLEKLRDGLTGWRDRRRQSRRGSRISSASSNRSDGSNSGTVTLSPVVERALITAVSAGSAGAVAAVVTTPVDVVKTRIMLAAAATSTTPSTSTSASTPTPHASSSSSTSKSKSKSSPRRMGSFAIAKDILVTEGFRGLWRGGALRAVWTMLGSGLYLGVYEGGRVWLAGRRAGIAIDDMELDAS